MRKYVRILCLAVLNMALLGGSGGISLYRAAQHEPEFYRQAMKVEPVQQVQAGNELEQGVLELRNETRHPGRWEAVFTEQQINGWLAVDLPDKFASMLPKGVDSPRVAVSDGLIHIAARYHDKLVDSVVSLALDVRLTDEPNTVAVTIQRVRAGALPVPVRQFLDKISSAAQRGDITLRWSQAEGDPVAFITIPSEHERYVHHRIYVETIEIRDGEIYLAGRTDSSQPPPRGDIAQRTYSGPLGENSKVQR